MPSLKAMWKTDVFFSYKKTVLQSLKQLKSLAKWWQALNFCSCLGNQFPNKKFQMAARVKIVQIFKTGNGREKEEKEEKEKLDI